MQDDSRPLYMVQIEVERPALVRHARRRRLPTHKVDNGYLVHSLLTEAFGDRAPKPFSLRPGAGRAVRLLGYSAHDAEALRDQASRYAEPDVYSAVPLQEIRSRPMPENWRRGESLGFEVRVCPVVRIGRPDTPVRKGAEVDAFLARCWEVDKNTPVDRVTVYREWLKRWFDRRDAASLKAVQVDRWQIARFFRRTQGPNRKSKPVRAPDVTCSGRLEVEDPASFSQLLARGVGRHRAFGFGMILLRPE